MKKLADLTQKRKRTVYKKDAQGNRRKTTEEYTAKMPIKTIMAWPRFILKIQYYYINYKNIGY
jgi:hypothetical protein